MGWKERRNGRRYYYRSVRTSTSVNSEYIGTGAIAEAIAESNEALAQLTTFLRRVWQEEIVQSKRADEELTRWLESVQRYTHATLRIWGYHQHKRQWRLARRRQEAVKSKNQTTEPKITRDQVMELVKAKTLTPEQWSELENGLKHNPSIVNNLGDMGVVVRQQLVHGIKHQPGVGVVWNARTQALRDEMGYASANPAERLVIDSVATCWLQLQLVTVAYQSFCQGGGTATQVATWETRMTAAHNRFARQVELLAKLRYWGSRVQQVNIAHNMIVTNT